MTADTALDKPQIRHDGPLTIATGTSRKSVTWKNREMSWSDLVAKLGTTTRTRETLAEYDKMLKPQKDEIKDVGGFVGGTLKEGRRTATNVGWRHVVTLDADTAGEGLWDAFTLMYDCAALVYSTHSHSPHKPRLRLCLPLAKPVTPDQYQAISRRIAADVGIDRFDDTTYQPHRLMYWPSTPADGQFVFELQDGKWLEPDEVLSRYEDWRDQSFWPVSSRAHEDRKKAADKQGDPTEKQGIVGAFCRTYDIHAAIEAFLSDVYQSAGDGRYTYVAGSTAGGLVVYDDGKFAFSHHGTDPVSGYLVNAFDLIRLHKFGDLDTNVRQDDGEKLPSYKAMVEFAEADEQVKETMRQERLAAIEEEFAGEEVDPKRLFFEKKRFVAAYMGEWFLRKHDAFVMNDDLYIYQDGVYVRGERVFREEATAALGAEFQRNRLGEALDYIKNMVPSVSPEEAANTQNVLNVKNGILHLDTLELTPHSPDLLTVVQLPVIYDPEADCSVIDRFLQTAVAPDCIPVIEEMAGYCLVPTMRYEKALMLIGEGGNGKGTLIAVLTAMLGSHNVSGVSFQDLSENRFASAELFGKMANLHADIPSKILENSSRFKELVSGDMIRAEEKHRPAFSFRNRAKLIFSANEPPVSKDNTEGFHRRLLMVPFPHKFTDTELRRQLFEPGALSGFLLRALEGLHRLQAQNGFTKPQTMEQALTEYRERGDTVFRFLEECCLFDDPDAMTSKQEVYDAYRTMCIQWGNQPINQANFNVRLQVLRPDIREYRKTAPRRWRGIKLEPQSDFLD